jgi:hypothetical protein
MAKFTFGKNIKPSTKQLAILDRAKARAKKDMLFTNYDLVSGVIQAQLEFEKRQSINDLF